MNLQQYQKNENGARVWNNFFEQRFQHGFFAIFASKIMRYCRAKIAFLVLSLVATSCVSRKKEVAPVPHQAFEWMTANVSIQAERYGEPVGNDLSGQLRMRRDSIVWLSVTATMGVEVMRVKMSTDSVWLLNRLDKTYLAESLEAVSSLSGLPVSLPWVQSLLLDNNEGLPPVENQTVLLQGPMLRGYSAKVRYSNIRLDKETTFPLKITEKMERIGIKRK